MTFLKKSLLGLAILFLMTSLQGCWFAAGAATGAAATEALDEKGYEITSPVQEEEDDDII